MEPTDDGAIKIQFLGLTPAEAAASARELETEFLAEGAPSSQVRVARDSAEAMDFGATLLLGAGILGWEFLKGGAKVAGTAVGQAAGRNVYSALRRKIDAFCQRRRVAVEVAVPGAGTWFLRTEYDRSNEAAASALPSDVGTLGVVILGASAFPHLDGLDNPAFARSAAAAKKLFAAPGPLFRGSAVLDLFDSEIQPFGIVDAIDRHIGAYPDMADLLIYYCGHGSFLRDRTYFLMLRGTRLGREASTGLKLKDMRHDLEAQLANRRLYLILDCCFAGAAVREFMGPNVDRVVESALHDALPPGGWVVLAASSSSVPAMAPAGQELTMFTGALTHVLGRAERPLSFDDIALQTRHFIQASHGTRGVLPECHAPMQYHGDLRRATLFGSGTVTVVNGKAGPNPVLDGVKQADAPAPPSSFPAEHFERWRAANSGEALAQCDLGWMFAMGRGVAQDEAEAVRWYREAADQGNAVAQSNLGLMFAMGRGVVQDEAEAVRWYRKAADQGNAVAQSNLGLMFADGRGVAQDEAEAVRWCRKAADQGNAQAQCSLGLMFADGRGVAQDEAEAVRWYRKAADQGNAQAQCNLGWMFAMGRGVAQDEAEAVRWSRKAADQGHDHAQCNLGAIFALGRGVAQDEAEAVRWYLKAADQGHAHAQWSLGWMFAIGRGVAEDDAEAARWFRKAAEQGHADAQFELGRIFENGYGVAQDEAEAVRWYRRAAEQGHADAQFNLREIFEDG